MLRRMTAGSMMAAVALFASCGGSGATTDAATTTGTLSISGTVQTPSATSGNVAKGAHGGRKSVSLEAASGYEVSIYEINSSGVPELIDTTTTDSSGQYTDTITTDGTHLLIVAEGADGTTVSTMAEVGSGATTLDAGTADIGTTLALEEACPDFTTSCTAETYTDFQFHDEVWDDIIADPTSNPTLAYLLELGAAGMMSGVDLDDLLADSLDDVTLATLADAAALLTGTSAATYLEYADDAQLFVGMMDDLLTGMKADAEMLAMLGDDSYGATLMDQYAAMFVGCDYAELTEFNSTDALTVLEGLATEAMTEAAAGTSSAEAFDLFGPALVEFIVAEDDLSSLAGTAAIDNMKALLDSIPDDMTGADLEQYCTLMEGIADEGGGLGNVDATEWAFYAEYVESNVESGSADAMSADALIGLAGSTYDTVGTDNADAYADCLSAGGTVSTCTAQMMESDTGNPGAPDSDSDSDDEGFDLNSTSWNLTGGSCTSGSPPSSITFSGSASTYLVEEGDEIFGRLTLTGPTTCTFELFTGSDYGTACVSCSLSESGFTFGGCDSDGDGGTCMGSYSFDS